MRFAFCLALLASATVSAEETLGAWLAANEPVVKQYLEQLTAKDIGTKLNGVTLSDGKRELEGCLFQANLSNSKKGLHAFRVLCQWPTSKQEIHYMWVDKGHKAAPFPECRGKWLFPNAAGVLSGDVYTEDSVKPTGELVLTNCVLTANNAFQPTDSPRFARLAAAERGRWAS